MIRPWIGIATVAFAAVFGHAAALADGKNEIRAVSFDEDSGTTRIHVRGAQTPTFTVYKLEKPTRVVIDVPQARLADALRGHENALVTTASTWAVSTIATQQIDDGGTFVRVIVSLARPGRYDVKTDGNEVVVAVTARDPAPVQASPAALAKAQADADRTRKELDVARQVAARDAAAAALRLADAERAKQAAVREAEAARAAVAREATAAKQAAVREAEAAVATATREAELAKREADAAKREIEAAKQAAAKEQATAQRAQASAAQALAARTEAEAARAKAEAAQAAQARSAQLAAQQAAEAARDKAEAIARAKAAEADAAQARAAAAKTQAEIEAARREVARTRAEAEAARGEVARTKAEAVAARSEVARTKAEADAARSEATAAKSEATAAKSEATAARDEATAAKSEATAARGEATAAKDAAAKAQAEAEAAKRAAAAEKLAAERDRKQAELARAEADRMLGAAKQQVAALDRKAQAAQVLEDKARASNAAAQAREEAAREAVAAAIKERAAAERAAREASERARQASTQVASERAKIDAEVRTAEERLAAARKASADAEARKTAAEGAAQTARKELDQTRTALGSVEQQRAAAEQAAAEAARKVAAEIAAAGDASRRRAEAEAAATAATAKRREAEQAAVAATQQRGEAEQQRAAAEAQRKAAEVAAREAKQAAIAAEQQRTVAEAAAKTAGERRVQAEAGLAELTARRTAAERAAIELEARSKAEAKAATELAAAQARKAGQAELAAARTEAARLGDERKRAEAELADRRKAVAAQQAEATRLETAAAQARDAAAREEARRAKLAQQRAEEEQALARLASAAAAAKAKAAPTAAATPAPATATLAVTTTKPAAATTAAPPPAAATTNPPVGKAPAAATPATPTPVAARAAPVAKVAPKAARIDDIKFTGADDRGEVAIALTGDASVTVGEVTATHAELIVDRAELAAKLERKLDVTRFGSPVRAVASFRDRRVPDRVRLVAELARPAAPTFDREGGVIRWRFAAAAPVAQRQALPPRALPGGGRPQSVPPPIVGGFGATAAPIAQASVAQLPPQAQRRRIYRGATITIEIKDAPIHDLLRLIADTGRVNIVIPDTITPRVTVRLQRVPWDQALEVILASHGLWYRREGNLYRVATRKELDAEDEAEAARREAAIKAEVPRPEVVSLNYASAADLKTKLEGMLSGRPGAKLEVDERSNSLIINDVAGNREQIARLALSLDTQTPQISIEARIVEARSTFLRQIGVQWGGRASASAAGGNATGLVWPSSVSLIGGNEDAQTIRNGVASPSDFAVNIPAATGSGEGGAIGLSLGSIGGNFNINLRLSALEDTGTIRIISAPKITVLNNKQAKISQGVSIPISVISASGTQTQFVQADLALEVTPYVSQRDCAIAMAVKVTKNEPDFVNVGARGDPTILRKEATTSMLINDGETSVLGGIYTRNTGLAYKKIPFFGDLPVLGWLFKNRRENDDRTEILVFITPKITNRPLLRCQ